MGNWYEMIKDLCVETGDSFENLVCTLSEDEMKMEFDIDYGREEGKPFTAWGEKYVYFPICYDGFEWVGFAPRNPCDIPMRHQGG